MHKLQPQWKNRINYYQQRCRNDVCIALAILSTVKGRGVIQSVMGIEFQLIF